jgi:hypothetical protein
MGERCPANIFSLAFIRTRTYEKFWRYAEIESQTRRQELEEKNASSGTRYGRDPCS